MNHSYCPSLSPQVLQFSRSANRGSHSDWGEICRDRGWTALDKDYPQLLSVKGCCGGGDLRRGHRCGWWHPDKYWGQEPSLITREHHQHQSLHTIKLYWKHPLEYVLCLQGAVSIYLLNIQQYKMHYTFQGSCLCSSSVKNVGKVIYCYGDLLPRNNGLLSQSKSSESGTGKSSSKDLIVAQLGVWVLGLLAL